MSEKLLTREEADAARIALAGTYRIEPDDEPNPNVATRAHRKLRAEIDRLSAQGKVGVEQVEDPIRVELSREEASELHDWLMARDHPKLMENTVMAIGTALGYGGSVEEPRRWRIPICKDCGGIYEPAWAMTPGCTCDPARPVKTVSHVEVAESVQPDHGERLGAILHDFASQVGRARLMHREGEDRRTRNELDALAETCKRFRAALSQPNKEDRSR